MLMREDEEQTRRIKDPRTITVHDVIGIVHMTGVRLQMDINCSGSIGKKKQGLAL